MTLNGWLQILFFLLAVFLVTPLLGGFMARVFTRQRTWLDPVLRPVERLVYRLTGVDETHEMRWTEYAVALLLFSVVSMLVLYAMQRLQAVLPFNPQGFAGVAPDLAFNTAASFTTNTNWQAYSGESTMSYFTQMAGLAYHNFVSAAVGISVAIAFIRGIAQKEKDTHRQLLGGHGARVALGAAADRDRRRAVPGLAGRGAEPQAVRQGRGDRSADGDDDDGRQGDADASPSRRSRRGRSRRRRSSSSSAPTAAASSTPTARTRSRTRRRSRTSWRCSASSRSRPASPTRSAR